MNKMVLFSILILLFINSSIAWNDESLNPVYRYDYTANPCVDRVNNINNVFKDGKNETGEVVEKVFYTSTQKACIEKPATVEEGAEKTEKVVGRCCFIIGYYKEDLSPNYDCYFDKYDDLDTVTGEEILNFWTDDEFVAVGVHCPATTGLHPEISYFNECKELRFKLNVKF